MSIPCVNQAFALDCLNQVSPSTVPDLVDELFSYKGEERQLMIRKIFRRLFQLEIYGVVRRDNTDRGVVWGVLE